MNPELIKQWAEHAGFGELLNDGVIQPSELAAFAALVAAHQRELDAKVCQDISDAGKMAYDGLTAEFCARAIRGRTE